MEEPAEWARPAVGGIVLGLFLLAIPQMYGVGYPVMYKTVAGGYVLWFLILLAAAKIVATSLSLGIGGSGGIFAPSLFIGVTSGYAFGDIADHIFGPGAGQPALYAVVAMGAVFASAARAPLTSLASVVEMTGNFAITLPVMLAIAIASTVSRALSYGTIYTTKLLRRGTDIDRAAPWRALQDLKVAGTMRPFRPANAHPAHHRPGQCRARLGRAGGTGHRPARPAGPVRHRIGDPGAAPARDLRPRWPARAVPGRGTGAGLGHRCQRAAGHLPPARRGPDRGGPGARHEEETPHAPPAPLAGYRVVELDVAPGTPADGARLDGLAWPAGSVPVSVLRARRYRDADPGFILRRGDQISLLVPTPGAADQAKASADGGAGADGGPAPGRRNGQASAGRAGSGPAPIPGRRRDGAPGLGRSGTPGCPGAGRPGAGRWPDRVRIGNPSRGHRSRSRAGTAQPGAGSTSQAGANARVGTFVEVLGARVPAPAARAGQAEVAMTLVNTDPSTNAVLVRASSPAARRAEFTRQGHVIPQISIPVRPGAPSWSGRPTRTGCCSPAYTAGCGPVRPSRSS